MDWNDLIEGVWWKGIYHWIPPKKGGKNGTKKEGGNKEFWEQRVEEDWEGVRKSGRKHVAKDKCRHVEHQKVWRPTIL